ncbi:MAG: hypothetical protein ACRD6B_01610 [Bryobacteraceae bacterium]
MKGAIRALEQVSKRFGDTVLLGAGSVLDPETARTCMLAGAEFFVTPSLNIKTIEVAKRYSKAIYLPRCSHAHRGYNGLAGRRRWH